MFLMNLIKLFLLLIGLGILVLIICCCKISSKISREEEKISDIKRKEG